MNILKKYWKWILVALILVISVLGLYVYKWEYRKPALDIYFFSINKGRAIFIRTPEGKTILIGGGQNADVIREITRVTPFYRRRIDMVITPSATPAQIGGLIDVIDRYEVGEILMPKILATSTVLTQLQKEIRKKKIHAREVERGDEVEIGGVKVRILFPYADFKFNKTSLPELGLSIKYGSTSAYLIGNLSKTIQKDILKNFEINNGENIVEYYNSMSDSKVSQELLEKIKPKFTFSTKEKNLHLVSLGEEWTKE